MFKKKRPLSFEGGLEIELVRDAVVAVAVAIDAVAADAFAVVDFVANRNGFTSCPHGIRKSDVVIVVGCWLLDQRNDSQSLHIIPSLSYR